jgi:hypothetical protein
MARLADRPLHGLFLRLDFQPENGVAKYDEAMAHRTAFYERVFEIESITNRKWYKRWQVRKVGTSQSTQFARSIWSRLAVVEEELVGG